ncbi:PREDICTED: uncharacterized protein LOC105360038 [Ceratosolen solmsi marchali]|uniref:Uncharacterized protein LOC105360038 n=1 Tax=Ceratosolen solmsi marchali TaxID=326594 RepID=A0AAJ6YC79_9HYME|nr:PREDICTED: uncharacterized protein LOC105360038 [Ceratosolen solmsi marchali]
MFMKAHKNIKNAYTFGVINYRAGIEIDNSKSINLAECDSNNILDRSFRKPFIVIFNENGSFKHIIIGNNEENISVNMKLLFSSLIQIQNTKLSHQKESKYAVNVTEHIMYGDCDVTYNINKMKLSRNSEALSIRKTYNMNSCSQIYYRDTTTNNEHLSECSTFSEADVDWKINSEMEIEKSNNTYILHNIKFSEFSSQIPLKDKLTRITTNQSTTMKLRFLPLTEPALETYDTDDVAAKKIRFGNINHSILQESSSIKYHKLRKIYKALVCDKTNQTIYLDLIQRAILCNAE